MDALHEGAELARVERPAYEEEGELVGAGVGDDGHEVVADSDKIDRAAIRPIGLPCAGSTNEPRPMGRVGGDRVAAGSVVAQSPCSVRSWSDCTSSHRAWNWQRCCAPTSSVDVEVPKLPVSSDPVAQVPTPPPVTPVTVDPQPVASDPRPTQPPVVPVVVDPQPQVPRTPWCPSSWSGRNPSQGRGRWPRARARPARSSPV
jgi:hypothetical protein